MYVMRRPKTQNPALSDLIHFHTNALPPLFTTEGFDSSTLRLLCEMTISTTEGYFPLASQFWDQFGMDAMGLASPPPFQCTGLCCPKGCSP